MAKPTTFVLNYRTFDDPEYVEIEYIDAVSNSTQGWYSPDEILGTKKMPNYPLLTRGWLVAEDDRSYMLMYARVGPFTNGDFNYSTDFVIQKGPGTIVRKIKIQYTGMVHCRRLQTPNELARFAYPLPEGWEKIDEDKYEHTPPSSMSSPHELEQQHNDDMRKRGRCSSKPVVIELKVGQRVRILHGGAYHEKATIQSKRKHGYYRVLIDDDDCGESAYHCSDLEPIEFETCIPDANEVPLGHDDDGEWLRGDGGVKLIDELNIKQVVVDLKKNIDKALNDIHERLSDD